MYSAARVFALEASRWMLAGTPTVAWMCGARGMLFARAMQAIFFVSVMPPAWMMSGWMMLTARLAKTFRNSYRV
jgi:hypothetical protein